VAVQRRIRCRNAAPVQKQDKTAPVSDSTPDSQCLTRRVARIHCPRVYSPYTLRQLRRRLKRTIKNARRRNATTHEGEAPFHVTSFLLDVVSSSPEIAADFLEFASSITPVLPIIGTCIILVLSVFIAFSPLSTRPSTPTPTPECLGATSPDSPAPTAPLRPAVVTSPAVLHSSPWVMFLLFVVLQLGAAMDPAASARASRYAGSYVAAATGATAAGVALAWRLSGHSASGRGMSAPATGGRGGWGGSVLQSETSSGDPFDVRGPSQFSAVSVGGDSGSEASEVDAGPQLLSGGKRRRHESAPQTESSLDVSASLSDAGGTAGAAMAWPLPPPATSAAERHDGLGAERHDLRDPEPHAVALDGDGDPAMAALEASLSSVSMGGASTHCSQSSSAPPPSNGAAASVVATAATVASAQNAVVAPSAHAVKRVAAGGGTPGERGRHASRVVGSAAAAAAAGRGGGRLSSSMAQAVMRAYRVSTLEEGLRNSDPTLREGLAGQRVSSGECVVRVWVVWWRWW